MFRKEEKEKEQTNTFGVRLNQYHPVTGKVIGTKEFYSDDAGTLAEWFDKNSSGGKRKKKNKKTENKKEKREGGK